MVAIPTIKYSFLFVAWYRLGLVERTLGVVCLSCGVQIQCLEINVTSGLPILLGTYDHPVTAGDGFIYWNRLNDTKGDVLIEAGFYLVLPVEGQWDRGVVGYWLGVLVNHEAHWWYFH